MELLGGRGVELPDLKQMSNQEVTWITEMSYQFSKIGNGKTADQKTQKDKRKVRIQRPEEGQCYRKTKKKKNFADNHYRK